MYWWLVLPAWPALGLAALGLSGFFGDGEKSHGESCCGRGSLAGLGLAASGCRAQGTRCKVTPWGPCLGSPGRGHPSWDQLAGRQDPAAWNQLGRAAWLRQQVTGPCENSRAGRELKSSAN